MAKKILVAVDTVVLPKAGGKPGEKHYVAPGASFEIEDTIAERLLARGAATLPAPSAPAADDKPEPRRGRQSDA